MVVPQVKTLHVTKENGVNITEIILSIKICNLKEHHKMLFLRGESVIKSILTINFSCVQFHIQIIDGGSRHVSQQPLLYSETRYNERCVAELWYQLLQSGNILIILFNFLKTKQKKTLPHKNTKIAEPIPIFINVCVSLCRRYGKI